MHDIYIYICTYYVNHIISIDTYISCILHHTLNITHVYVIFYIFKHHVLHMIYHVLYITYHILYIVIS